MPPYRKDLMLYHYHPKRRFYLVSMRLENQPGALGNLANILGIRGMNILEGYFGGVSASEGGVVSFFLESTNPKMDSA